MSDGDGKLTLTIKLSGHVAKELRRRAAAQKVAPEAIVASSLRGYLAPDLDAVLDFLAALEPQLRHRYARFAEVRFDELEEAPSDRSLDRVTEVARSVLAAPSKVPEWTQTFVRDHATRIAHDLDLIEPELRPGIRVLDVGAAPYLLSGALLALGHDVLALDLDPGRHAGAVERLGLEVLACDIERPPWPLEDASFDLIVFNELFEHLRVNPVATMGEALRVLAPHGRLTLSTPNLRSLEGLMAFLTKDRAMSCGGGIYDEYAKIAAIGHMGHVREYTLSEVADFMAAVGFRLIRVSYRGRRDGAGRMARRPPNWRPFMSLLFEPGPAGSRGAPEAQ